MLRVLLSMGHARGTAKTVLSEPGIKVRDEEMEEFERNMKQYIEAVNTFPVDGSVAFVCLDGPDIKTPGGKGHQWSFTGDSVNISPL